MVNGRSSGDREVRSFDDSYDRIFASMASLNQLFHTIYIGLDSCKNQSLNLLYSSGQDLDLGNCPPLCPTLIIRD
ncbi:hypothetical protein XELAEV_18045473mg [Xenopus laevis]|uniref:Uncharacterized protein n=1 Tax=Xenopus laevis TaxID=8355 RepID=A0A974H4Q2_XENLA|nr:hypothetical protein XELAEV_18045473mg [Xenopus laevis]